MDFEQARFNMVEQQIRTWDVLDQDVLDLLYVVRREDFVPAACRELAFSDLEIPLVPEAAHDGNDSRRMWQPKMEARVLQELGLKKSDRVLEVGTGSGYFTALLAHRSQHVTSVEISAALLAPVAARLAAHAIDNVALAQGDAAQGWSKDAPYDVIVLTASTPIVPQAVLEQLKPGGRLFAVVGDPPIMAARLVTCTEPGSYRSLDLFETCMAPLVNALQPKRFSF
ncbi:MAG TPA: protein-L-isoaspartate O-methyltransferase [Burkholderiales bacterium]|nr:protein-L-isoaspartate O-methyltransferase [Burkholderiales bacterium]